MKYKKNDIIVYDSKLYRCRIAGEEESLFEAMWIKGIFQYPTDTCAMEGSGGKDFGDTFVIYTDMSKNIKQKEYWVSNERNNHAALPYKYPVIGTYKECSISTLNLSRLKWDYPEDYRKYIEYLYNKEFPSIHKPIDQTNEEPKQRTGVDTISMTTDVKDSQPSYTFK